MESIEAINMKMTIVDREYNEIQSEIDNITRELNKKLNEKGVEYNKLLRLRKKLEKQEQDKKKREEQDKKRKEEAIKAECFKTHYQKFLNGLDDIYQSYLPIQSALQSVHDAFHVTRNITGIAFDRQTQTLNNELEVLRQRFNALIRPMRETCDHPVINYYGKPPRNEEPHFVRLGKYTEDVDKKCLELHTKLNKHKYTIEESCSDIWNVYCVKCKTVEKREYEMSF